MASRTLCFSATIVSMIASFSTLACNTANQGCEGKRTFKNTAAVRSCYRVFSDSHSHGFCLDPGESTTEDVRSGDRYCMIPKDEAPPNDCKASYVDTDS
jgi:hypothetical protein